MRRLATSLLVLSLGALGCQRSDAPVQPEKLASSSPTSGVASAAPSTSVAASSAPTVASSAPGPLVPLAKKEAAADDGGVPSPDGPAPSPKPRRRKKSKPTAKKSASASSAPAAASPAAAAGRVELVKAGAAPLEKRRFTPSLAQVDKLDMTMTMAIGMQVGAQAVPKSGLPPMVMQMNTKVVELKPDGTIRYDFSLTGTSVKAPPGTDPRVLKPLEEALGRLQGLGGHAVVTDRGITKEAKINLPKTLDQQTKQVMQGMEQAMNQISAPLPEEPIGVGAQWKYHTTLDQNGIVLKQVATYDLKRIEGNTLHCDVSVAQNAKPQKVKAPGGVTVDLLDLTSGGSGTTAIRLDHLAPSSSHIKLTSAVQMAGPKGQKMQVDTDMTIDIASP